MDLINQYILSSSLLFVNSNEEIKWYLMNQIFKHLEYVSIRNIYRANDIDFSSLLFELKEINHNLNTSKLKRIKIVTKIINIDSFNKYLIEFKHNKWNIKYEEEYHLKYIHLDRF